MRLIKSFDENYPIAFELSEDEREEALESGIYMEWCRAVLGESFQHKNDHIIMLKSIDAAFKFKLRWELEDEETYAVL